MRYSLALILFTTKNPRPRNLRWKHNLHSNKGGKHHLRQIHPRSNRGGKHSQRRIHLRVRSNRMSNLRGMIHDEVQGETPKGGSLLIGEDRVTED